MVRDHLPPQAAASLIRDPQWRLARAKDIGPAYHGVIKALFTDRVLDNLHAAQRLRRLAEKYAAIRIETAHHCQDSCPSTGVRVLT